MTARPATSGSRSPVGPEAAMLEAMASMWAATIVRVWSTTARSTLARSIHDRNKGRVAGPQGRVVADPLAQVLPALDVEGLARIAHRPVQAGCLGGGLDGEGPYQVLLVREVEVEGAVRRVGDVDDVLDPGAVVAPLVDRFHGRVEQPTHGLLALAAQGPFAGRLAHQVFRFGPRRAPVRAGPSLSGVGGHHRRLSCPDRSVGPGDGPTGQQLFHGTLGSGRRSGVGHRAVLEDHRLLGQSDGPVDLLLDDEQGGARPG